MPGPLADRIALVTGASRGIGQAIAIELGKQGAVVAGTSTTQEGAERIGQKLAAAGVKGGGMVLNVTDAAQTEAVVTEVQKRFGEIAILVNNAGVTRDNLLVRMKDEEWDDVMATDLKSVYRLSKLVLRSILAAHPQGHIVVLDPHNEYSRAFSGQCEQVRATDLDLPYWILNYEESASLMTLPNSDTRQQEMAILKGALLD